MNSKTLKIVSIITLAVIILGFLAYIKDFQAVNNPKPQPAPQPEARIIKWKIRRYCQLY